MRLPSSREVLAYVRLEEGDSTSSQLIPSSLKYLGAHQTPSGLSHHWSYPTSQGVAWVEFNAEGSLAIREQVPQSVQAATPPRDEHRVRKVPMRPEALPVARRTKPARPVWVPLEDLPGCHYHQAWTEQASFDAALKHYAATAIRSGSAGPGTRCFYIQLTSGRYACMESRRDQPQTTIISLEVDTRRAGKNSGGVVYVRDLEEILGSMGGTFTAPPGRHFISWSTDG